MSVCLEHRGPDSQGEWVDAHAGVALGHRRLSILDLSCEGNQPMASASGRYVVIFNGEIYNFREIVRALESEGAVIQWRGHSDTEVLLAAIERWGLAGALERCVGMLAIALWDRREGTLSLARDRAGEKPLYYGWLADGSFAFASELKAMRALPGFSPQVDRDSLALYFRHGYVPAPRSIYANVYKLPAASWLSLPWPMPAKGHRPQPVAYWSARAVAEAGIARPSGRDLIGAVDQLDDVLHQVVRQQMVADVPLGAFLSGGVDSSLIVSVMQAESARRVRTFTIGFTEQGFDEATHAAAVSRHLGTEHTELYVTPEEAQAIVPKLPSMFDEPFADSSQIPTALVAALARQHVTVSLSGDGGDELFGGYNRHLWAPRIWRQMAPIPRFARAGIATALRALGSDRIRYIAGPINSLLSQRRKVQRPVEKLEKLARVLAASDSTALYRSLASLGSEARGLVLGASAGGPTSSLADPLPEPASFVESMMYQDFVGYLADDILVKVDRACMAVGLEARVPFLDPRVVSFAWSLPLDLKIRDGQGKWILRLLLDRYVPRSLIERPKMGFAVPIASWLRGPLRCWAEDLLDPARIRAEGYLDAASVSRLWEAHLAGRRDESPRLWAILMFQAWLRAG